MRCARAAGAPGPGEALPLTARGGDGAASNSSLPGGVDGAGAGAGAAGVCACKVVRGSATRPASLHASIHASIHACLTSCATCT
jgi:hypothetical protein